MTTTVMCETDGLGWPGHLNSLLDDVDTDYWHLEKPIRYATGGITVALVAAGIDAALASRTDVPVLICIHLGANDAAPGNWATINETDWKNDYRYILDALHTKWPSALIYLGSSYRDDLIYQSYIDIMHGWINDLLAERPAYCLPGADAYTVFNGHPEYVPADDVHPNHLGCVALAGAYVTALGY